MSKKPIASLLVRIGADVRGMSVGSKEAIASMDRVAAQGAKLGKQLGKLGAAAIATGKALMVGLVKSGLRTIDENAKLARSLDGTIDGLQGLKMAAGDAGIDGLEGSLNRMNRRLGAVEMNSGPAIKSIERLGLNLKELQQLDIDQRVARIADAIRDSGMSSQEAARHLQQLGFEQKAAVELFMQGGDAIRAARQEVDDFGLSISEVDAAKIEEANDAMGVFRDVLQAISQRLTVVFAPILTELSNRFKTLAKDNKGFGDQAEKAAEIGIKSMSKVLDVLQGLRVAFKGLELIIAGFRGAMVSAGEVVIKAFSGVVDSVLAGNNLIIRALNKLPGVDIATVDPFKNSAFMAGLTQMGEDARNEVGRVRAELHELAMQELPSARAEEFLEAVRARAQEAAEATVGARRRGGGASDEMFGEDKSAAERAEREAERLAAEEARYKESLATRLMSLQEYLMTDEELATHQHEQRLEQLQAALDAELVSEQDAMAMREALEQRHQDNLSEIMRRAAQQQKAWEDMNLRERVKMVGGHLADITAGVSMHNRKMFELNKAAGIANAVVAAYEGIALTMSKYPFPLSAAMAAAQAAAAFAQVNAIKSASFSGGGGTAPSLAGGTAAPAVTPVTGGTPDSGGARNIFIQGISPESLVSGRQIAEMLEEFVGDGGRVVFGP